MTIINLATKSARIFRSPKGVKQDMYHFECSKTLIFICSIANIISRIEVQFDAIFWGFFVIMPGVPTSCRPEFITISEKTVVKFSLHLSKAAQIPLQFNGEKV